MGQDESPEPTYVNVAELGATQPTMMRAENRDGSAVIEGDIVIGNYSAIAGASQSALGIRFARYPGGKWPNNRIPYVISSDFTSAQRQQITSAINVFNSRSHRLKIVARNRESDYVFVISGNGCYSYLGRTGGPQTLSLQSSGCLNSGIIQHEFMHAAGVAHEHNRIDRDEHVKVLWDNIPQEWRSQYEKVGSDVFLDLGPYDCYSVMHYPLNAPGTLNPAFDPLSLDLLTCNPARLGQRNGPTDGDIAGVDALYP